MLNNIKSSNYELIHSKKRVKPLCFIEDRLLVFKKGKFYIMDLNTYKMEFISSIKQSFLFTFLSKFKFFTRLFRLEPRASVYVPMRNEVYFGYKNYIYVINLNDYKIKKDLKLREEMSAPLHIEYIENIKGFRNKIIFGEYFVNHNKKSVKIYSKDILEHKETSWEIIFTFPVSEINHIHSIVSDPFRNVVWITTGDFKNAPGIWYTKDEFKSVNSFVRGKQMYRTCALYPFEKELIYMTDTPLEQNYVYSIDENKNIKNILEINGSCIYSSKIGKDIVFSTTIEGSTTKNKLRNRLFRTKGPGIIGWNSFVYFGNSEEGFSKIFDAEKDYYSSGLMQFGTFMFPTGINLSDKIICYGRALKKAESKLLIFANDSNN